MFFYLKFTCDLSPSLFLPLSHSLSLPPSLPPSLPSDKIIQKIALKWLDVFLDLAGRVMLRFTANILIAVLPCLAYTGDREGTLMYTCTV